MAGPDLGEWLSTRHDLKYTSTASQRGQGATPSHLTLVSWPMPFCVDARRSREPIEFRDVGGLVLANLSPLMKVAAPTSRPGQRIRRQLAAITLPLG